MATTEADNLEKNQSLIRTREWLGKSIFVDEKIGCEKAVRSVEDTINQILKNGERLIKKGMREMVDSGHNEHVQITPAYIAFVNCSWMSELMQHKILQTFVGDKKENRPIEIAELDVIKGFGMVLSGLSQVYNQTMEERELNTWGINLELARQNPKRFIEDQVDFFRSFIKVKGALEPYENPELVDAGIVLGANAYKRMYSIVEEEFAKQKIQPKTVIPQTITV